MEKRPKALIWYDVYCYLFSALNFWTAWHALAAVRDPMRVVYGNSYLADRAMDRESVDMLEFAVKVGGWCFLVTGTFFGIVALSLPRAPVNKKTWVAHLVHIVFGATSCILTPLCVPLLFAWLRPDVKEWFGVGRPHSP